MLSEEKKIIQLLKSSDCKNKNIAHLILKGRGLSNFEVIQYKYNNHCEVTEEELINANVMSDCGHTLYRCIKCGSKDIEVRTIERECGTSCEEEHTCKACGHLIHWTYGAFEIN